MTTTPTTFALDPLHPELLLCEVCGATVATVDPAAIDPVAGITGDQAGRAFREQAEAIRLHEVTCSWRRAQAEGGGAAVSVHAREQQA
jgi:hypothetical protein